MARASNDATGEAGAFVIGVLTGLIVGSAVGVLYAPHRGDVTRRRLRRQAEDMRDRVDETMEGMAN